MSSLALPLLLCAAAWMIYRLLVAVAEWRLAWRPPPRAWLEVSVPAAADVVASEAMTRWWARVVHVAHGSRLRGRGQVDLLHLVTGGHVDGQPTLRTYVGCDPAALDAVRREIAQQFGGVATVVRAEDPLATHAACARDTVRARLPRRAAA